MLLSVLAMVASAQSYNLVANVIDGAGKPLASTGHRCQFSLAQSVASGQLASADYRAVLGFWNRGFRIGVSEPEPGPAMSRLQLERCRPNPVIDEADISYLLPSAAEVSLEVLDHCGRQVTTLVRSAQQPGRYRVRWNLAGVAQDRLPNGVYFVRLQAGEYLAVEKAVIAR